MKIKTPHLQIAGIISLAVLAFFLPFSMHNLQNVSKNPALCPGTCETIGFPIACPANNPVHDSLGDKYCKSIKHADNIFCCIRQNNNQCGNTNPCKAGSRCKIANQFCESQIACAGVDMAENAIFKCDPKTMKWVFKYNQAGGTCPAKNCGNACNCDPQHTACFITGQYCEKQIACTGSQPTNAVYQCQKNNQWKFLYNQKGGSCYSTCSLTPTPTVSPSPTP